VGRAADLLAAAGVVHEVVLVPEADHAFMRYAWEQQVIAQTVAWLAHHL
jgi:hypothetical protein